MHTPLGVKAPQVVHFPSSTRSGCQALLPQPRRPSLGVAADTMMKSGSERTLFLCIVGKGDVPLFEAQLAGAGSKAQVSRRPLAPSLRLALARRRPAR